MNDYLTNSIRQLLEETSKNSGHSISYNVPSQATDENDISFENGLNFKQSLAKLIKLEENF